MLRARERAGDLRAKAAELERDFAGYKRRLAERRACATVTAGDGAGGGGGAEGEAEQGAGEGTGRGRRYEEYVRRRDERLRQEWRARMERKEAEMKAFWARLDRAAGELAAASHGKEDHVNLQQKPGSLEVKVKPIAPVAPRCSPAPKLSRSRTVVPPSPAAASPRLSSPDARRRPSHVHRHLPQAEPPATPRKENRLPPPTSVVAAAAPATPRPRATLSRSRSMMLKDRSCSSGRDSPRPPRFQPPRTSCDGVSSIKEAPLSLDHGAVVVVQSRLCFSEDAVLAHLKKACSVTSEPARVGRSGSNGAEPASLPVTPKDESDSNEIAPASCNADNKCNNDEDVDQYSDKSGSPDITGDSETEPSYLYIKRGSSGDQTPRSSQVSPCPGTCPQPELLSKDKKDSCNFQGTTASSDADTIAGESPMVDAEEASRRASSESLYSNVRSSFSQRSELDTSATNSPLHSPPSCTIPPTDPPPADDAARPKMNPEEEDAEENLGSSVTVSITVQSPMDAMAGLKRFLTFGKKNGKAGEVATAVVERAPRSLVPAPPAGDRSMSRGWPIGDSVKARAGSSDPAASDDLDKSHVISAHVRPLQSFTPSSPANHELKEAVLHAKSPRVHRSFFSMPSFKSRAS